MTSHSMETSRRFAALTLTLYGDEAEGEKRTRRVALAPASH